MTDSRSPKCGRGLGLRRGDAPLPVVPPERIRKDRHHQRGDRAHLHREGLRCRLPTAGEGNWLPDGAAFRGKDVHVDLGSEASSVPVVPAVVDGQADGDQEGHLFDLQANHGDEGPPAAGSGHGRPVRLRDDHAIFGAHRKGAPRHGECGPQGLRQVPAGRSGPTSYRYQWYRSGTAVSGATTAALTLSGADLGKTTTVMVTAVRTGYRSASTTSASTEAAVA